MPQRNHRINDLVRRKIRELRKEKKLKIREIASLTGMPYSSYASLESGFYNINLDNLFRILGALEADIRAVWPAETAPSELVDNGFYLQRIQQFRLGEVISLAEAEGAALFAVSDGRCELLLHQGLSDFLLDRLILYLEDDLSYDQGIWFRKTDQGRVFQLFVKGEQCPPYLGKLIRKYMALWTELYR